MPADTTHECFLQPADPNVRIWRYMDFAKYVALLKDKALYFARLDTVGDPFEGSLSKAEFEHWKQVAQDGEANGRIPTRWRGKYFDVLLGNARHARRQCYVNCWHVNPIESDAMWRLYSTSGYAIAIVSTYSRLAECLPTDFQHTDDHRGPYLGLISMPIIIRTLSLLATSFTPLCTSVHRSRMNKNAGPWSGALGLNI